MRARENSSTSRSGTIRNSPSAHVTGNELINPSGTPYEPSEHTAIDTQSPSAVPAVQSRTWSIAALAALAADDEPRARMIAEPRCCTVGMNTSSIHRRSDTASSAGLFPTSAWDRSGYWVAEWLPQIDMRRIDAAGSPVRCANCAMARLWSSRVSALNRVRGTPGALFIAMRALVLAGLPTTRTLTSSAAAASIARPCVVKIAPFAASRSPRSMPFVRGRAPTSSATLAPSKPTTGSSVISTPFSSGNAPSSSSIATPSAARTAAGISSNRNRTGVSGPSMSPAAIRNSSP